MRKKGDFDPRLHLSRVKGNYAGICTGSTWETAWISVCSQHNLRACTGPHHSAVSASGARIMVIEVEKAHT